MTPQDIGQLAWQALMDEVRATPKPGLVDCSNSGAHRDMDLHTFEASANALRRHFTAFAQLGMDTVRVEQADVLDLLRPLGLRAEEDMYAATNGVNTHKGAIFSLGLLCAAGGRSLAQKRALSPVRLTRCVKAMTHGLCQREFAVLNTRNRHTGGERAYLRYGVTGARGEAQSGFASVRAYGYPRLRELLKKGVDYPTACVRTLLCLMANVTDTNILTRHDMDAALAVKAQAAALHRRYSPEGVIAMDNDLIGRNISPGGSADLLAVTLFLYSLHRSFHVKHSSHTNKMDKKGEKTQW